jgi:hypothetical protein
MSIFFSLFFIAFRRRHGESPNKGSLCLKPLHGQIFPDSMPTTSGLSCNILKQFLCFSITSSVASDVSISSDVDPADFS